MNKYISSLLVLLTLLSTQSEAQKQQSIGIHVLGWDYYGFLDDGDHFFVSENKNAVDSTKVSRLKWNPGIRFSYWREIHRIIDFNTNISMAAAQYPDNDTLLNTENRFVTDLDFRLSSPFIGRDHKLVPYAFVGLSPSYQYKSGWGIQVPVGLGLNINLTPQRDLALQLETGYKANLSDKTNDHIQHALGFIYNWTKEVAPVGPADSDGDGVTDDIDQCPEVAGIAAVGGCPDADLDGIADDQDKCPTEAGLAENSGCPVKVKDTDGDGINDDQDKCPDVAGLPNYEGFPPPDADGDGYPDNVDKCPNVASTTNDGCPVISEEVQDKIEEAASQVHFQTSKALLTEDSDENLDIIAGILNDNTLIRCDIHGYTDARGSYDFNIKLSEQRAKVCYDYLIAKGVDPSRLTYKGHGPDNPVASNNTAEGRAKNRRTEFKLSNK